MTTTYKITASEPNAAATIDALIRFLIPLLPSSLPIVAHLRTPPRRPNLTIYSSFDLIALLDNKVEESQARSAPPELFSIVTQCEPILVRYFCSGERDFNANDGRGWGAETDESRTADAHVESFFESWMPILFQESCGRPCLIGSLHHQWAPLLKKWTMEISAGDQKYIWDRGLASSHANVDHPASPLAVPPGFTLTPLSATEISRVIETSGIRRTREYVQMRLPYSLCLRKTDGAGGTSTAAGWGLIHAEGSVGTFWIEPEFRGKGYSRYVLNGLVQTHRQLLAATGEDDENFYINVDVVKGNIAATRLFESLGWKEAWKCFWVWVAPSDSPEVLSCSCS
ncbi:hypothetical protein FRB97_002332 [Tulasnella sp. 331]|nr:hypothetical protein FRB97_002332 [Tulasnella sp. 331]KAG8890217.1 hypothetical protein FRB98_000545 [Tulasnella sp. 332]